MNSSANPVPGSLYIAAWLVLLSLTGLSLLSAFLRLGVYGSIVQFGIVATQATIVLILFMRLKGPPH